MSTVPSTRWDDLLSSRALRDRLAAQGIPVGERFSANVGSPLFARLREETARLSGAGMQILAVRLVTALRNLKSSTLIPRAGHFTRPVTVAMGA